eukprot:tig00000737_g3796.t1
MTKAAELLSSRGRQYVSGSPPLHVTALATCLADPWREGRGENEGYINLSLAENKLPSFDILRDCMRSNPNLTVSEAGYDHPAGNARLRKEVAALMSRTLFDNAPRADADDLVLTAGAGSLLESLAFCIAEAGDAILVPAPYYSGFDNDLLTRAHVVIVGCPTQPERNFDFTKEDLDAGLREAQRRGLAVRALLLSSPNNPTGRVVSPEALREAMDWCLSRNIPHLLSDELYGNSVWGAGAKFVSAAAVLESHPRRAELLERVHVVYAFSKDFSMSGFRLGALYSKSASLRDAVSALTYFFLPSSYLASAMCRLLSDGPLVDRFLAANKPRAPPLRPAPPRATPPRVPEAPSPAEMLREAYGAVSSLLSGAGIPFVPADAGFFVWVDLRRFLPTPDTAGETLVWTRAFRDAKVVVTPGAPFHALEPGWFRICYAAVPSLGGLREGVRRLLVSLGLPPPPAKSSA